MFSTFNDIFNVTENTIPNITASWRSVQEECIQISAYETEYIPWDNPDNIISVEVERTIRRVKNNILAVLFLIGAPGNMINMAVFKRQGLKDRVNLCLFALSLADGIFLTQAMFLHGEQMYQQFATPEVHEPVVAFIANNNLVGFYGFQWVSLVLSAIIAAERCLCICSPLKFQTLLKTKTMAVIIATVYIVVVGFFFLVSVRYRVGCIYDPVTGVVLKELVVGEFYKSHEKFITNLDNAVYGACIPGTAITVVVITTTITSVKLRKIATWRAESSSSISAREVALTKMLIGNSILFIACITPNGLFRVVCFFMPDWNIGQPNQNFYQVGMWIMQTASFTNSTFNIFVYYSMGSRYRETFWSLFNRRRKLDTK